MVRPRVANVVIIDVYACIRKRAATRFHPSQKGRRHKYSRPHAPSARSPQPRLSPPSTGSRASLTARLAILQIS